MAEVGAEGLQAAGPQLSQILPESDGVKSRREPPLSMKTAIAQRCRAALLVVSFLTTCMCLHLQQWLGAPLIYLHRRWYHAWQVVVKASAAILLIGLNHLWVPVSAEISGDSSVVGQFHGGESPKCSFPDRIILIANHQIYTDWIFFWWTAYAARKHGHFFVILKAAIKKIPILGPGMQFFSFIFLSRRWDADKVHFQDGIDKLATCTSTPMWLLIFPEGTNMSKNARAASAKWATKSGLADLKHLILPRSRGLQCCLQGLASNVDWMYDCTIAYEDIPTGQYGQEVHSLKKLYIDGRKAPRAHMYWRRFAIKDVPYKDDEALQQWVLERWIEKDELLDVFQRHGRFPAADGYCSAHLQLRSWSEALQILYSVPAVVVTLLVCTWLYRSISSMLSSVS